ncbi:single-stranded DNA-binding protein [Georgenia sp. AZ-5]|uniref:single-stranded DNA-binding protein n=1 Tax=Georgenia sp. AZ-5 TaxID=3367526 RepID=UPI003753F070
MTIPTQDSLAGFIASTPEVSFTERGETRVHYRVGVEHWRREDDGSFTKLDSSFHDLLLSGRTAERAANIFRKGDTFVAHGQVENYPMERDGHANPRAVFVARRIGHDLARTRYTVDRRPAHDVDASPGVHQAEQTPQTARTDNGAGPPASAPSSRSRTAGAEHAPTISR